jgi:hypothetical protein
LPIFVTVDVKGVPRLDITFKLWLFYTAADSKRVFAQSNKIAKIEKNVIHFLKTAVSVCTIMIFRLF